MPQPPTKTIVLDETMIEPKDISQDQPKIETFPTSYKIPRYNQKNLTTPPKVKQFYKEKEKVVE
jgi:hypothetical protein